MPAKTAQVVHVVGPDTSCERWLVLRTLLAAADRLGRQVVLGLPGATPPLRDVRIDGWIRGAIWTHVSGVRDININLAVTHIWSLRAARSLQPAEPGEPAWIIDAPLLDGRAAACEAPIEGPRIFAAASERAAAAIRRIAVDERCVLTREGFASFSPQATRRRELREWFGYGRDQRVCLLLPPYSDEQECLRAPWGLMIAQRVHDGLRLLLPFGGAAASRIAELVAASGRRHILQRVGTRFDFDDLIAVADFAAFVPARPTDSAALARVCAAGLPVLASASTTLPEWGVSRDALIAEPERVDRIAARAVALLDDWDAALADAAALRDRLTDRRSQEAMLDAYAALYEQARARRGETDEPGESF